MRRIACALVGILMASHSAAELIVLAAPDHGDPYYADVADDIFEFQIAFAQQIVNAGDDVLVLTDRQLYNRYIRAIGANHVATAPQADIWMRDFTIANPAQPVMFRYTAAGQGGGRTGQREADAVQEIFSAVAEDAGLTWQDTELLNDGGNWVEDGHGHAVVSRKFLRDNRLNEAQALRQLRGLTGIHSAAFIEADEQGGLEHADGVAAFLEPGVLVINSYPDDPAYADALRSNLQAALPDVAIHTLVTAYDGSQVLDERFGSACGLYTNMLVTPTHIYLPQFGIAQDKDALDQVRALTRKLVIPVRSEQVCTMGGGVRCMSLQLRGANARALRAWADDQNR